MPEPKEMVEPEGSAGKLGFDAVVANGEACGWVVLPRFANPPELEDEDAWLERLAVVLPAEAKGD